MQPTGVMAAPLSHNPQVVVKDIGVVADSIGSIWRTPALLGV